MKTNKYPINVIISGGQTGADRAGLDFAIKNKIKHGGWCPAERLAEDGKIPSKYNLKETSTNLYPQRTKMNVKDSDATIIFTDSHISRGVMLTIECCQKLNKPYFLLPIITQTNNKTEIFQAYEALKVWLFKKKPHIINIAGTRKSKCPNIYDFVLKILGNTIEKDDNNSNIQWPPVLPTTLNFNFE